MTYETGELLGYSVAWKGSNGAVNLCDQARLLSEAEAILVANRILHPTLNYFLIEIHEALQEPEPLPEPAAAEVLQ